jgi:hypothetical protein
MATRVRSLVAFPICQGICNIVRVCLFLPSRKSRRNNRHTFAHKNENATRDLTGATTVLILAV